MTVETGTDSAARVQVIKAGSAEALVNKLVKVEIPCAPGFGKQIFEAETGEELINKLVKAHANATRKIREQNELLQHVEEIVQKLLRLVDQLRDFVKPVLSQRFLAQFDANIVQTLTVCGLASTVPRVKRHRMRGEVVPGLGTGEGLKKGIVSGGVGELGSPIPRYLSSVVNLGRSHAAAQPQAHAQTREELLRGAGPIRSTQHRP